MNYLHTLEALKPSGLAVALLLAMPVFAAQTSGPADVVGEVTAVIGLGKVLNLQGEQTASRGQLIRAGDRIETGAGGHVHVRFVDGGLISVRPLSRLHIEDYRNSDAQRMAAIKFRLEEGVMRSVTGEWGEAHRDRFRLNTPVAAIGIKGTDFVVKANSGSTLASVNSGAIVMAPLEGTCAAALGPCAGERSALLTAEMQGKMLEYSKQSDTNGPRLIPYGDLLTGNNTNSNATAVPMASRQRQSDASVSTVASTGHGQSGATQPGTVGLENKVIDNQIKETAAANMLPTDQPMVWLHNTAEWNVPANTISTRFDQAKAAGRKVVMGNLFINLYRDETTNKTFAPATQSVSFNLLGASANYVQNLGATELVGVSDARLTADFAQSTVSTQMNLSSPSMGQNQFSATATVTSQGKFVNTNDSQQIAGAFSNDGRQAGYLFEKRLANGTVSGLTLWGK